MNKERSYYWTMAFILPLFTTIVLMLSGCANSPSTENAKSPVIERPTKKLHFSGLVGVACNQDNDCNGALLCITKWATSTVKPNKEVKVCMSLDDADKAPTIIESHLDIKGINAECQASGYPAGTTDFDNCIMQIMNIIGDNK